MLEEEKFQRQCTTCPEIMLYFMIDSLGGFIWRMNHDMADMRIPVEQHAGIDKDLANVQKQIEFAVDHTTRFGLKEPRNSEGHATEEYSRWFGRWDGYVKSLSDEKFAELELALKAYSEALAEVEKWQPEAVPQV